MLRVRHYPGIMLRESKWLVGEDEVECVYLGRHVLKNDMSSKPIAAIAAMGLDTKELMTAARDRLGSEVDVPVILKEKGYEDKASANPKKNSIHSILLQRDQTLCGTYQSEGYAEMDFVAESDVCVDLGDDPEEDWVGSIDDRTQVVDRLRHKYEDHYEDMCCNHRHYCD